MSSKKIAILGDFNPAYATYHALNDSVSQVCRYLGEEIPCDWIATDAFDARTVFEKESYVGLWIAPGSPYNDFDNVLRVIQYCRTKSIPVFGNCGGFQHMVIEFARNVCGIRNADHEETNSDADDPVIHKLSCSLKGVEETLTVTSRDSLLYGIMKAESFPVRYFCSYGLNESYRNVLEAKGLLFTTLSEDGFVRSLELKSHPFFMGTLFQPALTSSVEMPNPLIVEFFRRVSGE